MKRSIVVAVLLLVPAVVSADPAPPPDAAPASTEYLSAGALLAADHALVGAVAVEGGHRLRGSLWLHASVARGSAAGVDENTYAGDYLAARVGLEERGCLADAVCAIAGLDLGYRHVGYMAESDSVDVGGPVLVPRLALDLGSEHLRFRPRIEGIVDGRSRTTVAGFDGLALTAAVAYQW